MPSYLGVPQTLAKWTPGLQNQVLALRTPPRALLAHSFWRPDFSRILGCLPGCLGRSIFRAQLNSSLEASNRAWRLKLVPGSRNSSLQVATQAWRPQVDTASRDRKSRAQVKSASRESKPGPQVEPSSINLGLQVKSASRDRESGPQVEPSSISLSRKFGKEPQKEGLQGGFPT